jgi:hypothetical protein
MIKLLSATIIALAITVILAIAVAYWLMIVIIDSGVR